VLKPLIAIAALALTAVAAPSQAAPKTLVCDGSFTGGTYFSVRVPAGADCTLTGAKVTHGVHAKGAANVRLIDTDVARNVNVRGTTGLTEIIQAGCKQDPVVGNNVMVRRSHDVLICQVHAKNNIMVTRNDGMISILDSHAGNNIMVNRNLAFVANNPPSGHPHPEWIRVFRNTAGGHIHEFNNDRVVVNRDDSPTPVIH
jgi:hypothetical protein